MGFAVNVAVGYVDMAYEGVEGMARRLENYAFLSLLG